MCHLVCGSLAQGDSPDQAPQELEGVVHERSSQLGEVWQQPLQQQVEWGISNNGGGSVVSHSNSTDLASTPDLQLSEPDAEFSETEGHVIDTQDQCSHCMQVTGVSSVCPTTCRLCGRVVCRYCSHLTSGRGIRSRLTCPTWVAQRQAPQPGDNLYTVDGEPICGHCRMVSIAHFSRCPHCNTFCCSTCHFKEADGYWPNCMFSAGGAANVQFVMPGQAGGSNDVFVPESGGEGQVSNPRCGRGWRDQYWG